jgi:hypothetical protein
MFENLTREKCRERLSDYLMRLEIIREEFTDLIDNFDEMGKRELPAYYNPIKEDLKQANKWMMDAWHWIDRNKALIARDDYFTHLKHMLVRIKEQGIKYPNSDTVKLKKEGCTIDKWELKIYPKIAYGNGNDLCIQIQIDMDTKDLILLIQVDKQYNQFKRVLTIRQDIRTDKLNFIDVASWRGNHLMDRLDALITSPEQVTDKIYDMLTSLYNGEEIISKYFDVDRFFYDSKDIYGKKFYEACMINFIEMFGGETKYFEPYVSCKKDVTIQDIKDVLGKVADKFYKTNQNINDLVDIGKIPGVSKDLIIRDKDLSCKYILTAINHEIEIYAKVNMEMKEIGMIAAAKNGKYKFFIKDETSKFTDKEFYIKNLPDDFTLILKRLYGILEKSLEYDKESWHVFVADQLRSMTYTNSEENRDWVRMLKDLITDNYEC